jgi:aspartyl-tRNA(Asn)/glutamyl-tRNA(Gln) amidotransferase subunit A
LSPLADWATCGVTIMLTEAYAIHEANLPLSFQIAGKRFADAGVLRLAHAYEQATLWRARRPLL